MQIDSNIISTVVSDIGVLGVYVYVRHKIIQYEIRIAKFINKIPTSISPDYITYVNKSEYALMKCSCTIRYLMMMCYRYFILVLMDDMHFTIIVFIKRRDNG